MYGAKSLLWNSKCPDYHNKSLRQDSWNEISSVMGLPIPDLKKKMTTLLASYRREKSRIAKSLITGSGVHDVYVSKWFAFDDFNFMKDKDKPNGTSDTMPDDIPTSHNVTTHDSDDKEPIAQPAMDVTDKRVERPKRIYKAPNILRKRNVKRKPNTEAESPMLKRAFQILSETLSSTSDPYFTYGQHIANELRKYDQQTLLYVKQAINNVIFEADLGQYRHHGAATHPPSTQSPQPPVQFPQTPMQSSPLPPQPSPKTLIEESEIDMIEANKFS